MQAGSPAYGWRSLRGSPRPRASARLGQGEETLRWPLPQSRTCHRVLTPGPLGAASLRKAWENAPVAVTALRWAYRRLGRHYPRVFLVLELQTVYPVILGTYAL